MVSQGNQLKKSLTCMVYKDRTLHRIEKKGIFGFKFGKPSQKHINT